MMRHFSHLAFGLLAGLALLTLTGESLHATETAHLPAQTVAKKTRVKNLAALPVLSLANFSQSGQTAKPPIGWTQFCGTYPEECAQKEDILTINQDLAPEAKIITLTQDHWATLNRINTLVNDTIEQVSDLDHYGVLEWWAFPDDGKGDCEDLQLLKRKLLVQAGFPLQTLLMTVVRDKHGEGHAVLMARTDRGDLILDSRISSIKVWQKTDYKFIKRQSEQDQNIWVYFSDGSDSLTTASPAK